MYDNVAFLYLSKGGKSGPATRYINPNTGKSVVVDNKTGEIFHVGGEIKGQALNFHFL